jgi:hypothetical protein
MAWKDPRSNPAAHKYAYEASVDRYKALSQSARRAVRSGVAMRARSDNEVNAEVCARLRHDRALRMCQKRVTSEGKENPAG